MEIKRTYSEVGPKKHKVVSGIIIKKLLTHDRVIFNPKGLISEGLQAGFLTLDYSQPIGQEPAGGSITLHSENRGDVRFNIIRGPGRWCAHCGIKLEDDDELGIMSGVKARAHVATQHAGEASPDPKAPAGYSCPRDYLCELAED
jgi:hypothetical protein